MVENDSDQFLLDLVWDSNLAGLSRAIQANPELVHRRLSGEGETLLHRAVALTEVQIATMLISAGADVNALDRKRNSPLHWAVRCPYDDPVSAVHLLVNSGSAINVRNTDWESPIMVSATYSNLTSFAYLLALGAKTTFRNRRDQDIADLVKIQANAAPKTKKYEWQIRNLKAMTQLLDVNGHLPSQN